MIAMTEILAHIETAGKQMEAVYMAVAGPLSRDLLDRAATGISAALTELASARAKAGDDNTSALLDDINWAEHDVLRAQRSIENIRAALALLERQ